MSMTEIFNYREVSDLLGIGGQPTAEQLQAAADAGVEVVVNISTNDPRYALAGEDQIVPALGMEYHYIPVDWDAPPSSDYWNFSRLMKQVTGRKVLLHCAANFRVTAFYSLFLMETEGWTAEEADDFVAETWKPADFPQWSEFITTIRSEIS